MKAIDTKRMRPNPGYVVTVVAVVLLASALTTAQTFTPLYTYPGASNNTSGITWPGLMSQGQDGEFYSTNLPNGSQNVGSVFKMTTAGEYSLLYSFCSE